MTAPRFRDVDLEVSSASDLRWLVEEFGEDVVNLYCGSAHGHFLATFETDKAREDADSAITEDHDPPASADEH